jgi:hypothetical protein
MTQTFGFEEALRLMKRGYRVKRVDWLYSLTLDGGLHTVSERGTRLRWNPKRDAILAEDWHLVDAEGGNP